MIAGGYSLHLYCDTNPCPHGNASCRGSADNRSPPGDYYEQTYQECARKARSDGWYLSRDRTVAKCPGCTKDFDNRSKAHHRNESL